MDLGQNPCKLHIYFGIHIFHVVEFTLDLYVDPVASPIHAIGIMIAGAITHIPNGKHADDGTRNAKTALITISARNAIAYKTSENNRIVLERYQTISIFVAISDFIFLNLI